ncbi:MAG: hypothetical protein MMC23_006293 [Stictis urceolatum]|nr:hypothetical protein [Stictis urceolata]
MTDTPIPPRPATSSPSKPVSYLPTNDAYARWAATYDSDGNALQALDDDELTTLLPSFLSLLTPTPQPGSTDPTAPAPTSAPPLIIDLGCGTGRNTAKLLAVPNAHVLGLDSSPEMLAIAKPRCEEILAAQNPARRAGTVQFDCWDMLSPGNMGPLLQSGGANAPTKILAAGTVGQPIPAPGAPSWAGSIGSADAVVGTLVVEHIPLPTYFKTVANLLRPGGWALVTNMHADMGEISQAGFNDPRTGEKVRPVSYKHAVGDVLEAAGGVGLKVVDVDGEGVRVREVREELVRDGKLGERARKWVGVKVWFGVVFTKSG